MEVAPHAHPHNWCAALSFATHHKVGADAAFCGRCAYSGAPMACGAYSWLRVHVPLGGHDPAYRNRVRGHCVHQVCAADGGASVCLGLRCLPWAPVLFRCFFLVTAPVVCSLVLASTLPSHIMFKLVHMTCARPKPWRCVPRLAQVRCCSESPLTSTPSPLPPCCLVLSCVPWQWLCQPGVLLLLQQLHPALGLHPVPVQGGHDAPRRGPRGVGGDSADRHSHQRTAVRCVWAPLAFLGED